MEEHYQHVYQSMRNCLVDRHRDDKDIIDNQRIVETPMGTYAFKKDVPSTSYLLVYSMLFHPEWIITLPDGRPGPIAIDCFVGGASNKAYPFLFNESIANIAVGLGYYTGLFKVAMHPITDKYVIIPNLNNPLVRETERLIKENDLNDYRHAKEMLVDLLMRDKFHYGVTLADDLIANNKFIEDTFYSIDESGAING